MSTLLRHLAVIPAKAGIHVAPMQKAKMDSRFRGNDGQAREIHYARASLSAR